MFSAWREIIRTFIYIQTRRISLLITPWMYLGLTWRAARDHIPREVKRLSKLSTYLALWRSRLVPQSLELLFRNSPAKTPMPNGSWTLMVLVTLLKSLTKRLNMIINIHRCFLWRTRVMISRHQQQAPSLFLGHLTESFSHPWKAASWACFSQAFFMNLFS